MCARQAQIRAPGWDRAEPELIFGLANRERSLADDQRFAELNAHMSAKEREAEAARKAQEDEENPDGELLQVARTTAVGRNPCGTSSKNALRLRCSTSL